MPDPTVSIVVIAYNMPREIPRTIRSLSTAMQVGVTRDDYEVILIDNGSTRKFDVDLCRAMDLNLRTEVLAPGDPSPCHAINFGLVMARGKLCGVMIDGARLASPGLVAGALRSHRLHHRPVVSTLGFHLGPDVQMRSVPQGYNQQEEDRLLDSIEWTQDGYRLFTISTFAGSSLRGWFAPISESNALFLTKDLWAELGGYDERFCSPGGGLVNHDTFGRACALPDSQLITLLGEGTFHQVHGGVATNAAEDVHPWNTFHDEYVRIRGRPFIKPDVTPLFLGYINRYVLPSIAVSADEAWNMLTPEVPKQQVREAETAYAKWVAGICAVSQELIGIARKGEAIILVDGDELALGRSYRGRRLIPFLEKDGQYWGPPTDDETAIRELERLRESGANFIAFASPAFWWLEHYAGFHRYLRSRFRCLLENDRFVVFDLREPAPITST